MRWPEASRLIDHIRSEQPELTPTTSEPHRTTSRLASSAYCRPNDSWKHSTAPMLETLRKRLEQTLCPERWRKIKQKPSRKQSSLLANYLSYK